MQGRRAETHDEFWAEPPAVWWKWNSVDLGDVYRQILASPQRQGEIIRHLVEGLKISSGALIGNESWADVVGNLLPVPKPLSFVETEGPARRAIKTDWLSGLIIVYAIRGEILRFVTDWDVTHGPSIWRRCANRPWTT